MKAHPVVVGLTALKIVLVAVAVVLQTNGHLSPQVAAILATAVGAFGLTSAVHAATAPREPSAATAQLLASLGGVAQQILAGSLGQPASNTPAPADTTAGQRGFVSLRAIPLALALGAVGLVGGFGGTACTAAQRSALQKDVAVARADLGKAAITLKDLSCLLGNHVPGLPTDVHVVTMAICDIADEDVPSAKAILEQLDTLAVSTFKPPPIPDAGKTP